VTVYEPGAGEHTGSSSYMQKLYIYTLVLMHFTDEMVISQQVKGRNGMCLRLDYRNPDYRD